MTLEELINKLNTISKDVSANVNTFKVITVKINSIDNNMYAPAKIIVKPTIQDMESVYLQDGRKLLRGNKTVEVDFLSLYSIGKILEEYVNTPLSERKISEYVIRHKYYVLKHNQMLLIHDPKGTNSFRLVSLDDNPIDLSNGDKYALNKSQYCVACDRGLITDKDYITNDYRRLMAVLE